MDDTAWDAPRAETLGDADAVEFGSDRPRRSYTAPRWLIATLAIVLGVLAGSGVTYIAFAGSAEAQRQPVPTTTTVNHDVMRPAPLRTGPFQPSLAPADPQMTYRAWCDARLLPHGGRFVATVVLTNMGNVGMTYLVTGSFRLSEIEVSQSATRAVSPGKVTRVQIVLPVTRNEVIANRALPIGQRCSSQVQLTGTFRDTSS